MWERLITFVVRGDYYVGEVNIIFKKCLKYIPLKRPDDAIKGH